MDAPFLAIFGRGVKKVLFEVLVSGVKILRNEGSVGLSSSKGMMNIKSGK